MNPHQVKMIDNIATTGLRLNIEKDLDKVIASDPMGSKAAAVLFGMMPAVLTSPKLSIENRRFALAMIVAKCVSLMMLAMIVDKTTDDDGDDAKAVASLIDLPQDVQDDLFKRVLSMVGEFSTNFHHRQIEVLRKSAVDKAIKQRAASDTVVN